MVKTFRLLLKDLLRSLARNITLLLSVVAIAFLSTCLFCGLTANAENVRARADLLYEKTDLADIYVDGTGLDTEKIQALDGVTKAEKRLKLPVFHERNAVYLLASDEEPTLSKPDIREGKEGLLLTKTYADSIGLKVGDTFTFSINTSLIGLKDTGELSILDYFLKEGYTGLFGSENIDLSMTVTGLMYFPEAVQNSSFSPSSVYATKDLLVDALYDFIGARYDVEALDRLLAIVRLDVRSLLSQFLSSMENQVLVSSTDIEKTTAGLDALLSGDDSAYWTLATDMSFYTGLEQEVDQAMQLTFVFPVFFFLVSLLIILTTLSQLIIRERKSIGTLKAIGIPRKLIYLHYVLYGILLVLIGTILGFVCGPLLIPRVLSIKYNLLWDLPTVPVRFFHPLSFSLCLCLLALTGVAAFFVSFSVIREKPVDTLRPKVEKAKARKSDPDSFYSRHTSLSLRMAVRNILKNKGKSLMVVLGMLGCTALLVCGFGIMDTLDYDVRLDYGVNMSIDAVVTPLAATDSLKATIASDPAVERVEDYKTYPITARGERTASVDLILVEPDSSFFNVPVGVDEGVTLDGQTAADLSVGVGDTIALAYAGQVVEKTVTVVFDSSFLQGVFDLYSGYDKTVFVPETYYVTLKDGSDADAFATQMRQNPDILSVMTYDDLMEQADNILSSISTMTDVVKIFAILLSVIVVYNLTALNLAERKRAIATMKVLGFRFGEIAKMLTYELFVDALVGSLIGMGLGYPLTVLVLSINRTDLLHYVYHVQWYTYLLAVAISLLTTVVVSLLLDTRIKKVSMSTSLKSVE